MLEFDPASITDYVFGVGTKQFTDVISPPYNFVNVTEYSLGPQMSVPDPFELFLILTESLT